jgi:hypothetical protein
MGVTLLRRMLLAIALALSFAIHAPMLCSATQMASSSAPAQCPLHSRIPTQAPCCRVVNGCSSSLSAQHEVVSVEAPAFVPMSQPVMIRGYDRLFEEFTRVPALSPSPPRLITRGTEFSPLLI